MSSIGIATACMNREHNLIKALPYWINSNIDKIHIIDWSSNVNLKEFIVSNLGHNDKIEVFRINGKSRWILTHAFNLALSSLDTDYIAKFDSDHICESDFFTKINLKKGNFYRFNLKDNSIGTNGAFICDRNILKKANFFDERIVTYGWDESDLFERIQEYASNVVFLEKNIIKHLPHKSSERIENQDLLLEQRISHYLNVNDNEFNTRANFFKVSLSKKWSLDSQSGFIVKNKDELIRKVNFIQKEFFDQNLLYLSIVLTIEYFQNIKSSNLQSSLKSNQIVKDFLKEIIEENISESFFNQWDLINSIKMIDQFNEIYNKDYFINKLKSLYINSSLTEKLKDKRIEFLNRLARFLLCK